MKNTKLLVVATSHNEQHVDSSEGLLLIQVYGLSVWYLQQSLIIEQLEQINVSFKKARLLCKPIYSTSSPRTWINSKL